jgi:xanthine dehydrogenase accessory factor
MDVFYEFCGPSQRLVIFGAGHVSSALASMLAAAPLEIVVADDRPEWNTIERFPRCRRVMHWGEGVAIACEQPASTLACVMTCSHDTDYDLLKALLASPPAFVGLIGSRSKRACLFRRLVASGVDEQAVQAVQCPIGLGDMGKQPELIAVSMAGQILLEAKRLARL